MKYHWMPALCCLLMMFAIVPSASAETFELGERSVDTDRDRWYVFSSGSNVMMRYFIVGGGQENVEDEMVDNITRIFDGNSSTGINQTINSTIERMEIRVIFLHPIFVTSVTIDPIFEGMGTNYSCWAQYAGQPWGVNPGSEDQQHRKFNYNCSLSYLVLDLRPHQSGRLVFNDVIINYTNANWMNDTLYDLYLDLQASINSIESKLENLTSKVDLLWDKHHYLEKKLNKTNKKVNGTGNALKLAEENITELQDLYDELNQTLSNITYQLTQLNSTTGLDLGGLGEEFNRIRSDLALLDQSLNDLRSGSGGMQEVVERMNETARDLEMLDHNVTALTDDMGEGFNDTTPGERVFSLESENIELQAEVSELTADVDDLSAELQAQKEAQDEDATTLDTSEILLILIPTILVVVIMAAIMMVIFRRSMRKQMSELKESFTPPPDEGLVQKSPMGPGIGGSTALKPTPVPVPAGVSLADSPTPLLLPNPSAPSSRVKPPGGSTMKAEFNDWLTSDAAGLSKAEMLSLLESRRKEGAVSEEIYTYLTDEIKGME